MFKNFSQISSNLSLTVVIIIVVAVNCLGSNSFFPGPQSLDADGRWNNSSSDSSDLCPHKLDLGKGKVDS